MAVIGGAFATAFQLNPLAFQSNAFQVNTAFVDAAGDIATPQEIAYLERRRRVQKYLDERRKRYELAKRRVLDKQIDDLLANRRSPLTGKPFGLESASTKPPAAPAPVAKPDLPLAAAPKPSAPQSVRHDPNSPEAIAGRQMLAAYAAQQSQQQTQTLALLDHYAQKSGTDIGAMLQASNPSAQSSVPILLADYARDQGQVNDEAIAQIMGAPSTPFMSPDQLRAAFAQDVNS